MHRAKQARFQPLAHRFALSLRLCTLTTACATPSLVPIQAFRLSLCAPLTVPEKAAECPSLQSHSFELCTVRYVANRNASSRSGLMTADFSEIRRIISTGLDIEPRPRTNIQKRGGKHLGKNIGANRYPWTSAKGRRNSTDELGHTRSNTSKQL
jgi:hypothetical protein